MAVPLFDTATPLAPLQAEIVERIGEVVGSGAFILGPEVKAFEAGVRRLSRRQATWSASPTAPTRW